MKPGRELDALVAEKVMGWERMDLGPINGIRWRDPDGYVHEIKYVAEYSTDISAAWVVVEKKFERWKLHLLKSSEGRWRARLLGDFGYVGHDKGFEAEAYTAPHAICLAALKAVGAELVEA